MDDRSGENSLEIVSRSELDAFFKRDNPYRHLYEIGDLDDMFYSHSRYFGVKDVSGVLQCVALFYSSGGKSEPVLIVHTDDSCAGTGYGNELLYAMMSDSTLLPNRFHSHLSTALIPMLKNMYAPSDQLKHFRMKFCCESNMQTIESIDTSTAVNLTPAQVDEVECFFADSYPGNWFDPRMLHSKQMFGVYDAENSEGRVLVAVAGIHVYSKEYNVATLGNIAVRPNYRGRGLARIVIAALLKNMLHGSEHVSCEVEYIGLNVEASNIAAIKCYQKLGFEMVSEFCEVMWDRREGSVDLLSIVDGHLEDSVDRRVQLLQCARTGDSLTLKSILNQSVSDESIDINTRDSKQQTALHLACNGGHTACVEILLHVPGIDVNSQSNTGVTPMIMSAVKGHANTVAAMLSDARVDPNAVGFRGRGAVAGAALHGHADALDVLLRDPRVNPCVVDDMGRTPLVDVALSIVKKGMTHMRRRVLLLLLDNCPAEQKKVKIAEALHLISTQEGDERSQEGGRAVVNLLEREMQALNLSINK